MQKSKNNEIKIINKKAKLQVIDIPEKRGQNK